MSSATSLIRATFFNYYSTVEVNLLRFWKAGNMKLASKLMGHTPQRCKGYKNRFQNFIRYLPEMGDKVIVVTTHEGVLEEFYGAKVIGSRSFPCPWYQKVHLSLALSPRIISEIARFKPDIIHASSPGITVTIKKSLLEITLLIYKCMYVRKCNERLSSIDLTQSSNCVSTVEVCLIRFLEALPLSVIISLPAI
ncbi:unnamed protein product [Brassica oleracea]